MVVALSLIGSHLGYRLHERRHVQDLLGDVRGGSEKVRENALNELASMGPKAGYAVPALLEIVAQNEPYELYPPAVRGRCLLTNEEAVASSVINALARIGEPAVGPAVNNLRDGSEEKRISAAIALARIGVVAKRSAAAVAERVTHDRNDRVRTVSVYSLGYIGAWNEDVRLAVTTALGDSSGPVRYEAAATIGHWVRPQTRLLLLRHILWTSDDEQFRGHIAGAMGQLGSAEVVEDLVRLVEDCAPQTRDRLGTRSAAVSARCHRKRLIFR